MDYGGILTVSVGLVALLLAFDQVIDWGWGDPRIIALLALFVILISSFVFVERRAGDHALVPPDVISNRDFAYTCAAILLMSAVFFASMLYLPQVFDDQTRAGLLADRRGRRHAADDGCDLRRGLLRGRTPLRALRIQAPLILGSGCIAIGPALIALLADRETFGALIPGMAILGSGIGLFYPTATTVGVTSCDEARRSLAGAIIYMFQIAGRLRRPRADHHRLHRRQRPGPPAGPSSSTASRRPSPWTPPLPWADS